VGRSLLAFCQCNWRQSELGEAQLCQPESSAKALSTGIGDLYGAARLPQEYSAAQGIELNGGYAHITGDFGLCSAEN
jgi:hypothetical protein